VRDAARGPVVVMSRQWKEPDHELSFAVRAIAGAASRGGPVTVIVPGSNPGPEPDGAFDIVSIGSGTEGGWPDHTEEILGRHVPDDSVFVVDELTPETDALIRRLGGSPRVCALSGPAGHQGEITLSVVRTDEDAGDRFVGLHIPVNPLAGAHRHNGFGFVGYLLVLSGRTGHHEDPPDAAAWLTAGNHDANVVVIEDATASVWRGRALRGKTSIDSRTDLWRLIAHAHVCIDLAPGPLVARECVESLRFGTPIIVPEDAPAAAAHAVAGGGLVYRDMADLLLQVGRCESESVRARLSGDGREYADTLYGDPNLFCDRVFRALWD
jgi:hypothetical protein